MNKKLQNAIREFIGDDPAQAVERVRENFPEARQLIVRLLGFRWHDKLRNSALIEIAQARAIDRYGLAAYGAGLAAVMGFDLTDLALRRADLAELELSTGNTLEIVLGYVATADAETRIAAMLWAAAWIVEVNENE